MGCVSVRPSVCLRFPLLLRMFIGQGNKGSGEKGMKQAEQKKLVADFKAGLFNVMVATCIAEEGLDIPQVGPGSHSALGPASDPKP
jgi:Helicase conserved C-terminal domain